MKYHSSLKKHDLDLYFSHEIFQMQNLFFHTNISLLAFDDTKLILSKNKANNHSIIIKVPRVFLLVSHYFDVSILMLSFSSQNASDFERKTFPPVLCSCTTNGRIWNGEKIRYLKKIDVPPRTSTVFFIFFFICFFSFKNVNRNCTINGQSLRRKREAGGGGHCRPTADDAKMYL